MENLSQLYREFLRWRERHPDSYYIVFDDRLTYWGRPLNRYIVVKAVEMYRFFSDIVVFTISGKQQLHNPICCSCQKEATTLCRDLNARWVHDNEPDLFAISPSWQEAYSLIK